MGSSENFMVKDIIDYDETTSEEDLYERVLTFLIRERNLRRRVFTKEEMERLNSILNNHPNSENIYEISEATCYRKDETMTSTGGPLNLHRAKGYKLWRRGEGKIPELDLIRPVQDPPIRGIYCKTLFFCFTSDPPEGEFLEDPNLNRVLNFPTKKQDMLYDPITQDTIRKDNLDVFYHKTKAEKEADRWFEKQRAERLAARADGSYWRDPYWGNCDYDDYYDDY